MGGHPNLRIGVVTSVLGMDPSLYSTLDSVRRSADLAGTQVLHVVSNGGVKNPALAELVRHMTESSTCWTGVVNEECDESFYEGLKNGFQALDTWADCDWFGYLNAGDVWFSGTAGCIAAVSRVQRIDWFTGTNSYHSQGGIPTIVVEPFRYRRQLIQRVMYGRFLPGIQQESTFWSRRLHFHIDWNSVCNSSVAGDAEIWRQLAASSDLFVIQALLGSFQMCGDHLSQTIDYKSELRRLDQGPQGSFGALKDLLHAVVEAAIWRIPSHRLRMLLEPDLYFVANTDGESWRNSRGEKIRFEP